MMNLIFLLGLSHFLVQLYESNTFVSKRVMNGGPTPPGKLNGMVALSLKNPLTKREFCSGFVVDEFTILTAAHCFFEYKSTTTVYSSPNQITTGSDFQFPESDKTAIYINPEKIEVFINPEYIQLAALLPLESSKYDIAIIKTTIALKFKKGFEPIPVSFDLPNIDHHQKKYRIIGFGDPNNEGRLNWSPICHQLIHVKEGGLNVKNKWVLRGDSGGALLEELNNKFTAIGVTSSYVRGDHLNLLSEKVNETTYFAPLYDNRDFIMSRMGNKPSQCGNADVKIMRGGDKSFQNPDFQYPSHHVWLLALYAINERFLCFATYIGKDVIVTAKKCLVDGNKAIQIHKVSDAIATTQWRKVFHTLDISKQGANYITVFDENNIVGISLPTPVSKLFYLRRVCSHKLWPDVALENKNLLSVSLETDNSKKNFFLEMPQVFTDYKDQKNTMCTKFWSPKYHFHKNLMNYGDPLLSIHEGQYYLEGILTSKSNLKMCFSLLVSCKMRMHDSCVRCEQEKMN